MNWIKIKEDNSNLPQFGKIVFLLEKKYEEPFEHKVDAGKLISIDANGRHWSSSSQTLFDMDFSSIFGGGNSKKITKDKESFNPTHYCEIEIPND
jgi:hypothetical protein